MLLCWPIHVRLEGDTGPLRAGPTLCWCVVTNMKDVTRYFCDIISDFCNTLYEKVETTV